jgi:hypothetical protein
MYEPRRDCQLKLHAREISGERVEWTGRKEWQEGTKNIVSVTVEVFIVPNSDHII